MKWLVLRLTSSPENAERVAAILAARTSAGTAIENPVPGGKETRSATVTAYLPFSRMLKSARETVMAGLREFNLDDKVVTEETVLKEEEWLDSLKANFAPLSVGRNFLVKPSWVEAPAGPGRYVINLDPGAAFGTGDHPTTRMCLEYLDRNLTAGMSVLDLGTGTGVLAIASARLGCRSVLALDTDAAAIWAAKVNVTRNQVAGTVTVKRGTLTRHFQSKHRGEFDLVVANIAGPILANLAPGFFQVLAQGGRLFLSGFTSHGLDEVLINLAVAGFSLKDLARAEEWRAVLAGRP